AFQKRGGRIGDHLLEQQVHEEEQRLGLEDQQHRLVFRIVVEVLMHTAGLDDHDVAGLPIDAPSVMDVVASTLDDEEDGAVEMSVLLAVCAWSVSFDMRLDRL